jgi:hypothetical protein
MKKHILAPVIALGLVVGASSASADSKGPIAFAVGAIAFTVSGIVAGAAVTAIFNKQEYEIAISCPADEQAACCTPTAWCFPPSSSNPICPAGSSAFCGHSMNGFTGYSPAPGFIHTPQAEQGILAGKILLGVFCPLAFLSLLGLAATNV